MTQPLRLVHASDFHLELPLHGLAEIPDHLRELLIEAPYHAAEQVFETRSLKMWMPCYWPATYCTSTELVRLPSCCFWINSRGLANAASPFTGQAARWTCPTPGPAASHAGKCARIPCRTRRVADLVGAAAK